MIYSHFYDENRVKQYSSFIQNSQDSNSIQDIKQKVNEDGKRKAQRSRSPTSESLNFSSFCNQRNNKVDAKTKFYSINQELNHSDKILKANKLKNYDLDLSEESLTPSLSTDSAEYDFKDEGRIKQVPSTRKIHGMSDKASKAKKIFSFL